MYLTRREAERQTDRRGDQRCQKIFGNWRLGKIGIWSGNMPKRPELSADRDTNTGPASTRIFDRISVRLIVKSDSGHREATKIRDRIGLNTFSEMFCTGGNYRRHVRGFN